MAAQGRRKDRIAILASGAGSNAEAILAHFEGQAAAEVAEVVWVCTNREKARRPSIGGEVWGGRKPPFQS